MTEDRQPWTRIYDGGEIPITSEMIPDYPGLLMFYDDHQVIKLGTWWKEIQKIIEFHGYKISELKKTIKSESKKDGEDLKEFLRLINRQFGSAGSIKFPKEHEFASKNLIYMTYLNAQETWELKQGICGEQAILLLGILRKLGFQSTLCRPFRSHFGVIVKVPGLRYYVLDPSVRKNVTWKESLIRRKLTYPRQKFLGSNEYTYEGPITLWEYLWGHKTAVGFRQIEYHRILENLGISSQNPVIGLEIENAWTEKIFEDSNFKIGASTERRIRKFRKIRKSLIFGAASKKVVNETLQIVKSKFPDLKVKMPAIYRKKLAKSLSKTITKEYSEDLASEYLEQIILKKLLELGDK